MFFCLLVCNILSAQNQPNIILFLVDDMGWQDTSEPFLYDGNGNAITTSLNQRYRTPNIEALADKGLKFTNAYAMPVCTPTRVSIITGKNSVNHKVTNWTNPTGTETGQSSTTSHNSPSNWLRDGLQSSEITLPTILKNAGYRTITAGKAHFGNSNYAKDPLNVGFDINIGGSEIGRPGTYSGDYGQGGSRPVPHLNQYHNTNTHLTEALTLEVNQAMENAVNDNIPFYLQMAHYAVHSPFEEDPRFSSNYPGIPNDERNYATLVEGIDKSLGDITTKLQQLGIAEETIIIFMTDNGGDAPTDFVDQSNAPLRHKKGSQYEGGIRVPLIVSWATPNSNNNFQSFLPIQNGGIENDIVACFDIFPTITGLANATYTHQIDGHDLQPYIAGNAGLHRPQNLLIHFPHDHRTDYYTIYREDEWKLIYNYASDFYELYNLDNDISEANNVASTEPNRVMLMARKMAQALDANNAQWPTFNNNGQDDPFIMPNLPNVDIDNDGIPDNIEDPNFNGLVDAGETDPDVANQTCTIGASCDDNDPCTTGDSYDANCNCIGINNANGSVASIININTGGDSFTRGGSYANDNYGGNNTIITKLATNAEYSRTGFLKFDLNGYNASDVASATLHLNVVSNAAVNVNQNLFFVQGDSWVEGGITWTNQPGTTSLIANFSVSPNSQNVTIDVTSAVVATLNENNLLSLKIEGTNNQYIAYASREQGATSAPSITLTLGGSCDDGDPCTVGESLDANCNCTGGIFQDADNDTVCDTNDICAGFDDNLIGTNCDDNDACTTGETYDSNCNCTSGVFQDADNDGVCDANDMCAGFDDNLIGTTCDDGDPCTTGETYDSNCNCTGGVFQDADNDNVCDANDMCAGFDDNIDTDNDNIPDACDDCLDVFLEMNNPNIASNRQAKVSIQSNGIVLTNSSIIYHAGQQIDLVNDFEVKQGAEFYAHILACN